MTTEIDKVTRIRLAQFAFLLLAVLGLALVLWRVLTLETLMAHEAWLREMLRLRPISGLAVALVAFVVLSLIPGLAGKSVICGWLLGFLRGLVIVNFGLTIAALAGFFISRYCLRDFVRSKLDWFMRRLRVRHLHDSDGTFLLTLRLLHAPFTVTNYAVGATDVSVRRFWWTTQVGMLPSNIAYVLAGASLPSLKDLESRGIVSVVNVPLLIGLTLAGLAPLAIRWAVRRNLQRSPRERLS